MNRPQTADYAAVGVGPVLIFLMISSLANFFVMLFYDGGYSDRVFYLILMYTMGSVALARLVIEEDRAYSAGYAIALGLAMLFVMTGFLGSLLFVLGLVLLIGYLADRIVHDCTVIDESVDASGEGLIDRSLDEANGMSQRNTADRDPEAPESEKAKRRRKSHQPGRTVFLLALAALPLFGVGQFLLQDNPNVWARAQLMLGIYLFSSLSLLVTTSFLNLRRYLRQRQVDMPGDVTVAWLAGGVALVAALLMLAFLAPMPGLALANFSVPKFLGSDDRSASDYGWGDEAAEKSNSESNAQTSQDRNPGSKQQRGAGENQNRPSGKTGGKKPGQQSGGQQSGGQQSGGQQSGGQQSGGQQSGGQQSGGQQSGGQQSGGQQSGGQQSGGQQSGGQQSGGQQSGGQSQSNASDQSSDGQRESGNTSGEPSQRDSSGSESQDGENGSSDANSQQNENGTDQRQQQSASQDSPSSTSRTMPSVSGLISSLTGLLRLLMILVLIAIVAYYLYQIREQLMRWWQSLFQSTTESNSAIDQPVAQMLKMPPKPFASFSNPIGRESDPNRVVITTFQAFEAWARERGYERRDDETPSEFTLRLRKLALRRHDAQQWFSPIGDAIHRLSAAYDRIAYGQVAAKSRDVDVAGNIWRQMESKG